jgi:hypothetical protein
MGLVNEVTKTCMVSKSISQRQVLGHLHDLGVQDMARIIRKRYMNQCSLAIGATGVRDVAIPAATFAEDSNRVKIKAAMQHA